MSADLKPGLEKEISFKTTPEHTARYFYDNLPDVFATPFLAGFMERVSAELIDDCLEEGSQSVGVSMSLKHTSATPLGMTVRVQAQVTGVEGSKITLALQAWDETEKIGEAVHERFIINTEKFNARVEKKSAKTAL